MDRDGRGKCGWFFGEYWGLMLYMGRRVLYTERGVMGSDG